MFTVACAGVLLLLGAALGVVAAILVAHRTAQSAADLAALAAAAAVGRSDPCARASQVASANGARLQTCEVAGREVEIVVDVAGPRWLGQRADLGARARAGPVASGPVASGPVASGPVASGPVAGGPVPPRLLA